MTPSLSIPESTVVARLRAAGCVFAEDEARLLISEASDSAELEWMLKQRVAGLPLEQILGWVEFCGLRIAVQPAVFVPRRRSELLAVRAIGLLGCRSRPVVLDLCCGSGAIATAIAAHVGSVELYASDIHPTAVACTRRNLGDRGRVFQGDLFAPLPTDLYGRIDVVVANAPYVPTGRLSSMPTEARLYEPRLASDGGRDGHDLHRRLATTAPHWLSQGGHLLVECSEQQASSLSEILTASGLIARVDRLEDSDSTIVIGRKGAGSSSRAQG